MSTPERLLDQNREWRDRVEAQSPELFEELSRGQAPDVLWIGCADSRVPPTRIVDCEAGDLFVHRNVANLVHYSDANGMSVVQYAVDELEVSHVIVCGHYRCGGVRAVLSGGAKGHLSDWLTPLQSDLEQVLSSGGLANLSEQERWDRCCELNVESQVQKLAETDVLRRAWRRGQDLTLHGWIYRLEDGRIRDLGVSVDGDAFA